MYYLGKNSRQWISMVICAALLPTSVGCATIIKPVHQEVEIISGKKGIKMFTPHQNFELKKGVNRLYFKRSTKDIPVSLLCTPKSKPKMVYLETSPNLWFLIGNLFIGTLAAGPSLASAAIELEETQETLSLTNLILFVGGLLLGGYLFDYASEQGWNISTPINISGYCGK